MEQKTDKPSDENSPAPGSVIDATEGAGMSAEGNEKAEPSSAAPIEKVKIKKKKPLARIYEHVNIYFLIFIFMLVIAGFIAAIAILNSKKANEPTTAKNTTLDEKTISELSGTDSKVGDPKQTLTVESNAIFAGKVLVKDGLDVGGQIKVGGSLAVAGLSVSGTSAFDQIQTKGIAISGDAAVEGQLSVQKNIAVTGNGTFNGSVSAKSLSVENFQINRDLQLQRHIDTGGGTPKITGGSAIGGGGTVSINGSDTAGTVTINTGSGPGGGTLATVTFVLPFTSTPHVVASPVGIAAGNLDYFITRTSTGFTISTINAPSSSSSFSFDYIAMD